MTIKELKEQIEYLPDNCILAYHGWNKGFCLSEYESRDCWTYPKNTDNIEDIKAFVLNPGENYDGRKPIKTHE